MYLEGTEFPAFKMDSFVSTLTCYRAAISNTSNFPRSSYKRPGRHNITDGRSDSFTGINRDMASVPLKPHGDVSKSNKLHAVLS